MDEMKYRCRADDHGSRRLRNGASIPVCYKGKPAGRARNRKNRSGSSGQNIPSRRRLLAGGGQVFQSRRMRAYESLTACAEIERLIGKVYFRFSHLFIQHPTLRDYWWEMAAAKDRHARNLTVLCALVENDFSADDLGLEREKAERLKEWLSAYLRMGVPAIAPEEAFRVARKMETWAKEIIASDGLDAGYFPAGFLFSRGDCHAA